VEVLEQVVVGLGDVVFECGLEVDELFGLHDIGADRLRHLVLGVDVAVKLLCVECVVHVLVYG